MEDLLARLEPAEAAERGEVEKVYGEVQALLERTSKLTARSAAILARR